jgi:xanthine dehydrogenase accessory factor
MRHIHLKALELIRSGERFVWATLTSSAGSTPQVPGSTALFGEKGLLAGTVGGGIMEADAGRLAAGLTGKGTSNIYRFNLNSDQESDGAICGGEAHILLDASPSIHEKALTALQETLKSRQGGKLLTLVGKETEKSRKIERYWIAGNDLSSLPRRIRNQVGKAPESAPGESFMSGLELKEIPLQSPSNYELAYVEYLLPLPRLIIAGAGHLGRALSHLGRLLDFEVTVVDDRREYANPLNLPDADQILVDDIGSTMEGIKPDSDTYCVIVTRGHHQDSNALKPLIASGAAYVGMIGSRHKVAVMRKRFLDAGWATPEQWDNIHAPVGLPIGSKTVQEIALSIAAQLVAERNKSFEKNGK